MKNDRIASIREYIRDKNVVKVDVLCKLFAISPNTARRYLMDLEKEGLLRRTYGGAIIIHVNEVSPETSRAVIEASAKELIARKAADLIMDGDIIFFDTGSTVANVLCYLDPAKKITAVTHSIPVILNALKMSNVYLICLGGAYHENTNSLYADGSVNEVSRMNFSKLFMGCTGVTAEGGVTNMTFFETALKQEVIDHSDVICLLADHTKIGTNALRSICPLQSVDVFVTDTPPDDAFSEKCESYNVELITAK